MIRWTLTTTADNADQTRADDGAEPDRRAAISAATSAARHAITTTEHTHTIRYFVEVDDEILAALAVTTTTTNGLGATPALDALDALDADNKEAEKTTYSTT